MVCSHIWLDWLTFPRDDCHFFYIFLSFLKNLWQTFATWQQKKKGGGGGALCSQSYWG